MARKKLPIDQRHRAGCRRRDCDCPWTCRVRLPDGSMRRVTCPTYAGAEQAYHELMARRPEPLADRTTTIGQWAPRYLKAGELRWARNNLARVSGAVRNHVLPYFGNHVLTEVHRSDVEEWILWMRGRGTPPWAQLGAIEALSAMYGEWLADDRMLPRGNPVAGARQKVKRPPRKQFTVPTPAQIQAMAAAARDSQSRVRTIRPSSPVKIWFDDRPMAVMIEVQAFYGMRVSELRALRESDVTFTGREAGELTAAQLAALAALPADGYDRRTPLLRIERKLERDRTEGPMKNPDRGVRSLPLPQWLAGKLAAQIRAWPPVDGWLFWNPRGPGGAGAFARAVHPRPWGERAYNEAFKRCAAAAGVTLPPHMSTHLMRHYAVSQLRALKFDEQAIAYWIGDAEISVSAHYGRPVHGAIDRIAADLSRLREESPARQLRAVD